MMGMPFRSYRIRSVEYVFARVSKSIWLSALISCRYLSRMPLVHAVLIWFILSLIIFCCRSVYGWLMEKKVIKPTNISVMTTAAMMENWMRVLYNTLSKLILNFHLSVVSVTFNIFIRSDNHRTAITIKLKASNSIKKNVSDVMF